MGHTQPVSLKGGLKSIGFPLAPLEKGYRVHTSHAVTDMPVSIPPSPPCKRGEPTQSPPFQGGFRGIEKSPLERGI